MWRSGPSRTLVAKFAELIQEGKDSDGGGAGQLPQVEQPVVEVALYAPAAQQQRRAVNQEAHRSTPPWLLGTATQGITSRGAARIFQTDAEAGPRLATAGDPGRVVSLARVESTLSEGLLVLLSSTKTETSDLASRLPAFVPARNRGCRDENW